MLRRLFSFKRGGPSSLSPSKPEDWSSAFWLRATCGKSKVPRRRRSTRTHRRHLLCAIFDTVLYDRLFSDARALSPRSRNFCHRHYRHYGRVRSRRSPWHDRELVHLCLTRPSAGSGLRGPERPPSVVPENRTSLWRKHTQGFPAALVRVFC